MLCIKRFEGKDTGYIVQAPVLLVLTILAFCSAFMFNLPTMLFIAFPMLAASVISFGYWLSTPTPAVYYTLGFRSPFRVERRVARLDRQIQVCRDELKRAISDSDYETILISRIEELTACKNAIEKVKERKHRDKILDSTNKTVLKELKGRG